MKTIRYIFPILCFAALLSSCAEGSVEINTEDAYNRVITSWMRVYYPERISNTTDSGAYILEEETGTGAKPTDSSYVFVHYVKTDLDGDIEDTNEEDLARQLMQFARTSYYGPDIWRLGQGYIPCAVEETLLGMRVGGFAKIACPLAASECSYSVYNAFEETSASDNEIYYLYLEKIVEDINAYQIEQIEAFRDSVFPGLDSLQEGFYFKKLIEVEIPVDTNGVKDTIADGTSINVRYIGRLLNGQVFDTNIQDTAKKYRIYSSSADYDALEIEYYQDKDDCISNNSLVDGFSIAVSKMYYGECADTFFWSDLGYEASGSEESIPEYSPLRFTIWIEEDDD